MHWRMIVILHACIWFDSFRFQSDFGCPDGGCSLLCDRERKVNLCDDCRGEFADNAG